MIAILFFMISCSGNNQSAEAQNETETEEKPGLVGYVDLTEPLEQALIDQGQGLFETKCSKCHTIDTVNFSVPSFAGITNRRSPEWIMNMILNAESMVRADSTANALLRKHRKIMPDPELEVDEARAMLEYLRNNDEIQVGDRDKGRKE